MFTPSLRSIPISAGTVNLSLFQSVDVCIPIQVLRMMEKVGRGLSRPFSEDHPSMGTILIVIAVDYPL